MDFDVEKYLSNLSYINKDFPSLWNELLETVPKLTNKWLPSEANESDPLVVLLKLLAITADKLNYNADKNILELFPATLTQTRSAYNVYETLGYTPDWYVSATTTITIIYNGLIGGAVETEDLSAYSATIPLFTQVTDDDTEIVYTLLETVTLIPAVPTKVTVHAIEGTMNDLTVNGSTQITISNLDSQNRIYFTETNIAQNGIIISNYSDFSDYSYSTLFDDTYDVDSDEPTEVWRRVTNLNQYESGNKIYKLGIDATSGDVYLQFPDDIGTLIGDGIYIKYVLSNGENGNIGKNDITAFYNVTSFTASAASSSDDDTSTTYSLTTSSDFTVTNTQSVQNGSDPLDIEDMWLQYNKIAGTFNTLVTLRDYEDYLYNYSDTLGNHIVSNIRVSDRFHDMFDTLNYKGMDSSGVINSYTLDLKYGSGDNSGDALMTANDLRLYPLIYTTPIEDDEAFDTTFNVGESVTTKVIESLRGDIIGTNNQDDGVLATAKCISHDFMDGIGSPVLIPYDLEGQIYLQTTVSSVDAAEILSNVQLAMYETLNSRELEWGKMLDYGTVVDAIKDADSRIQYVALNAISYKTPKISLPTDASNDNASYALVDFNEAEGEEVSETTVGYTSRRDRGYDTTVRTILNGNKTWTDFVPYIFDYNQTGGYIYGNGNTVEGVELNKVSQLQTDISFGDANASNLFVVGPSETFCVLTPQYNTILSYSNYLYYILVGGSQDNPTTIEADVPTVVPDNCSILFFTTRDAANEYASGDSTTAEYTIPSGTIIQSSTALTFDGQKTVQTTGSSVTIETLERATGTIQASDTLTTTAQAVNGSSIESYVYIATNSEALCEALNGNSSSGKRSYTLLADEYLFYTDDLGLELGIVSEGTTLTTEATITDLEALSTTSSLLNGSLPQSYRTTWQRIASGALSYELNTLTTFGENYAIRCKCGENFVNFIDRDTATNTFFDLVEVGDDDTSNLIDTVQYALITTNDDGSTSVGDWSSLDRVQSTDAYQALIRLACISGPGVEQQLHMIGSKSISDSSNTFIASAKTQQLVITGTNSSGDSREVTIAPTSTNTPLGVQASSLIAYQGGAPLTFVDDGTDDSSSNEALITFYVYNVTSDNSVVGSDDVFVSASAVTNGTTMPSINGGGYCIIPCIVANSGNAVQYLLVRGGVTISSSNTNTDITDEDATLTIGDISGITYLGRPYFITDDAEYYNATDREYESVSNILDSSSDAVVLITEYLYIGGYCPLYTPSSSETIDDPTAPESFFVSSHPYNRFVLPYLDSMDGLQISTQSISG